MASRAQQNTVWQTKVRRLLSEGLGVEDMIAQYEMNGADVRREVQILRESGELSQIYRRQNV